MDKNDIIRMALKVGVTPVDVLTRGHYPFDIDQLERFINIVASEERERIAKKIEKLPFGDTSLSFCKI